MAGCTSDFNYSQMALKELKEAMEEYKNEKVDIHMVYYKITNLMFWLGTFVDKNYNVIEKEDKELCLAIRFACNVLKHDKTIFEIGKKSFISCGVCGEMFCGEDLTLNSITIPIIVWAELDNNCIQNQQGIKEYNKFFRQRELDDTFGIIERIINKYSIS